MKEVNFFSEFKNKILKIKRKISFKLFSFIIVSGISDGVCACFVTKEAHSGVTHPFACFQPKNS